MCTLWPKRQTDLSVRNAIHRGYISVYKLPCSKVQVIVYSGKMKVAHNILETMLNIAILNWVDSAPAPHGETSIATILWKASVLGMCAFLYRQWMNVRWCMISGCTCLFRQVGHMLHYLVSQIQIYLILQSSFGGCLRGFSSNSGNCWRLKDLILNMWYLVNGDALSGDGIWYRKISLSFWLHSTHFKSKHKFWCQLYVSRT